MTPARFERINRVLDRRQPDLHVVVENVHKPHNLAAIARSCDAVGALNIHAVSRKPHIRMGQKAAMGTGKWLVLHQHNNTRDPLTALRQSGVQLVAVSPGDSARDFRELDYTRPTALVVGTELDGLSPEAVGICDEEVLIPMSGMVASLNVSVACALVLFEAQRQRQNAGAYKACRLPQSLRSKLLFEMCHPSLADHCQRHDLNYPPLDDLGHVCVVE